MTETNSLPYIYYPHTPPDQSPSTYPRDNSGTLGSPLQRFNSTSAVCGRGDDDIGELGCDAGDEGSAGSSAGEECEGLVGLTFGDDG